MNRLRTIGTAMTLATTALIAGTASATPFAEVLASHASLEALTNQLLTFSLLGLGMLGLAIQGTPRELPAKLSNQ